MRRRNRNPTVAGLKPGIESYLESELIYKKS
jgi:hypothetical protein